MKNIILTGSNGLIGNEILNFFIKKNFNLILVDRKFKKRLTIKIGQHIKIIHIDEIECFYSEHKSTYIHTKENRNHLLDNS